VFERTLSYPRHRRIFIVIRDSIIPKSLIILLILRLMPLSFETEMKTIYQDDKFLQEKNR